MKTMAEVLAKHGRWRYTKGAGTDIVCSACGEPVGNLIEHQADALTAAGYGPVNAVAVVHVAHDTEAHARSFNEGYETAMAQELADDPTTAQDWLDAKLHAAGAQALRDAAERFSQRSDTLYNTMREMTASREYGLEDVVRYGAYAAEASTTAAWLRTQAAKAATP